tara:strand:+ start:3121 stop:4404 length:1284 start_codon:yes stop_codon:yes gene_type:complete
MNSLLEQAIVDANDLRDAALKNAQVEILEKYSTEVRSAVETILEQEMVMPPEEEDLAAINPEDIFGAGMGDPAAEPDALADIPSASMGGEPACPCPEDGEQLSLTITVDQLRQIDDELSKQGEMGMPMPREDLADEAADLADPEELMGLGEGLEIDDDLLMGAIAEAMSEALSEGGAAARTGNEDHDQGHDRMLQDRLHEEDEELEEGGAAARTGNEDRDVGRERMHADRIHESDIDIESLIEELITDLTAEASEDWAGKPESDRNYDMAATEAEESSTEDVDEATAIRLGMYENTIKKLKTENSKLLESNKEFKKILSQFRDKLEEVTLRNAKLLYTNQTLSSPSLNERQKTKIVESIQKAGSIEEAKVIHETLQSAVGPSRTRKESLSEVIRRPSTTIPRRTKTNSQRDLVVKDRFQRLAGISRE